jgi:hypothetical protein
VSDAYGGPLTTAVAAVNTGRKRRVTEINPETVCDFGLPRFGPVNPETGTALTTKAVEQEAQAATMTGEETFESVCGI